MEQQFKTQFNALPDGSVTVHGRVNLLGEHTDYSGGLVLPAATRQAITVHYAGHDGSGIQVYSDRMDETDEFQPGAEEKTHRWPDYVRGISAVISNRGVDLPPGHLLISGDLPMEVGLASSAALEVACARALFDMSSEPVPDAKELAKLCMQAENSFVGVPCGIMDPYASAALKPGEILFLNCRSLDSAKVSPPDDEYEILLFDTGIRRKLAEEKYDQRVNEMREARDTLQEKGIRFSGKISTESLNMMIHVLPEPLDERVRHVARENRRVREGVHFLKDGKYQEFGSLMQQSHRSLSKHFEVSCDELDLLVELLMESDQVYGVKMTGAGFGGAVVCLAKPGARESVSEHVKTYKEKTNLQPDSWIL